MISFNPTPSPLSRRQLLQTSGAALLLGGTGAATGQAAEPAQATAKSPAASLAPAAGAQPTKPARTHLGVSTYSFWQFKNEDWHDLDKCIDAAAELGFDGVEILHRQMQDETNGTLQKLKKRAFVNGLSLCGFSTHQGFLSPDATERKKNIDHTIHCIELAYAMGIPTMRVNTGRWGTSKDFDALMANRGIEPNLPGYTDDDGYKWVIESLTQCLPAAEKCGVFLGLENHWGLGRTPEGVLKIIKAINSPWLKATLDTGNFLEDPYDRLEMMAPEAILVQAKTYYGGGLWYALDLDYPRIAAMLRKHKYRGWISLEFEGKEDPAVGVKKSVELMRAAFG